MLEGARHEHAEGSERRERAVTAGRELAELEHMLDEARREGAEQRVRELEGERRRIHEMLEGFRREHAAEEEEMHRHRAHLEMERAELETSFGRLEMVGRIAQISETEVSAAAFAVMHIEQFMEVPDAVEFLQEMLEQSKNDCGATYDSHPIAGAQRGSKTARGSTGPIATSDPG